MWKGKHPEGKWGIPSSGMEIGPKKQYNSPWEIKLAIEVATLLLTSGLQCYIKSNCWCCGGHCNSKYDDAVGWHWQEKNNWNLWKLKEETKAKMKKL